MKIWKLGAFIGLTSAKTDVNYNHHQPIPEVAQLEKWNALAHKFFRTHQEDLRPNFYRKWALPSPGIPNGRFEKEIMKLETNFIRCAEKHHDKRKLPRKVPPTNVPDAVVNNPTEETRKRRSDDQLSIDDNPDYQMRHIVQNVRKWTEEYLAGCSNQEKVVRRWEKFVVRWKTKAFKNSKMKSIQEELKKEERYLRNSDGPGRPCGKIYREFGLTGYMMELRDGSYDVNNRFDNLKDTQFGNDQLMSMRPYEGKFFVI